MTTKQHFFYWTLSFTVPPIAIGLLAGWFVGSSQSPVVGAIVPVVIALLGGAVFKRTGTVAANEKVKERLKSLRDSEKCPEDLATDVDLIIEETAKVPLWTLPYTVLAIALFCISLYAGTELGIAKRVPTYPSVDEMMGDVDFTPSERVYLHQIRWQLISKNVPPNEVVLIFSRTLQPVVKGEVKEHSEDDYAPSESERIRILGQVAGIVSSDSSQPISLPRKSLPSSGKPYAGHDVHYLIWAQDIEDNVRIVKRSDQNTQTKYIGITEVTFSDDFRTLSVALQRRGGYSTVWTEEEVKAELRILVKETRSQLSTEVKDRTKPITAVNVLNPKTLDMGGS